MRVVAERSARRFDLGVDRRRCLRAELGSERQALGRGGDAITTSAFRHETGTVGGDQDIRGRRSIGRERGDADRRRHGTAQTTDCGTCPLGEATRTCGIGARQEERELVTAIAEHQVALAA